MTSVLDPRDGLPTTTPVRPRIPRQRRREGPIASVTPLRPGGTASDAAHLIEPPSDAELYSYFSTRLPWVHWMLGGCFVLVATSTFLFAQQSKWLWPLLAVLALNLVAHLLSAVVGWRATTMTPQLHRERVDRWAAAHPQAPEIDVFLPTCGEDLQVLRNAYRHVAALHWRAAVHVHVLDDAHRPEVAALAAEHRWNYIARPDRGHLKKAGNLNHALTCTSAPYVLVLDADYVPRSDFLDHLVPYFDDPTVGLVQSPQYFATTREMGWVERAAGASEEFFYRWLQPARRRSGSAMCVGTCAMYRRAALEVIDGFARIDHSEDVHTGHLMSRAGLVTEYVPVVLSRGLCPTELSAYLDQHYRWCNGTIFPLLRGQGPVAPLPWGQRLGWVAGKFYYVTTAVNVLSLPIPLLVMSAAYGDAIRPWHVIPFLPGIWLNLALFPRVSRGRYRPMVLAAQSAAAFAYVVAVAHRLTGRTQAWVATGARGERSPAIATSVLGAGTLTTVLTAGWSLLAADVVREGLADLWGAVALLCLYTALMTPLLVGFLQVLQIVPPTRRPEPSRRFLPEDGPISRLHFLSLSALVLAVGVLASGLLNAHLPWG